jgi:hypothetical protein
VPDRDIGRQKGIGLAHRALEIARDDPYVVADAAYALACFGEDLEAMTALVDRTLASNPNYARGWPGCGLRWARREPPASPAR